MLQNNRNIHLLTLPTLSPKNIYPYIPSRIAVAFRHLAPQPDIPGPVYRNSTPSLSARTGASYPLETLLRMVVDSFLEKASPNLFALACCFPETMLTALSKVFIVVKLVICLGWRLWSKRDAVDDNMVRWSTLLPLGPCEAGAEGTWKWTNYIQRIMISLELRLTFTPASLLRFLVVTAANEVNRVGKVALNFS